MPIRRMHLRYAGTCSICQTPLAAGTEAEWDPDRRVVTCAPCADDPSAAAAPGAAGGSAKAKADELNARQAEQHRRVKDAHPILGRIVLAVQNEAPAGQSWERGAAGEGIVGGTLDRMAEAGVLSLHDRLLPRSKANIDHLAVTSNGVWVIDAKKYKGLLRRIDKGGWFRTDVRLIVAGRDRTSLIDGVHRQVDHVQRALRPGFGDTVPVHGALCFVGTEWDLLARAFTLDGVLVCWNAPLKKAMQVSGPLDAEQRAAIHRTLATAFPPAA